MKISLLETQKSEICDRILRSLPDWFGIEGAIQNYVREFAGLPAFIAEDQGETVGFLSLVLHNECTAEIHVVGVLPQKHRSGAGRALVEAAESYLREKNFEFLSVKTISPAKKHGPYLKTWNFYVSMGFKPVEVFKTLWGEHNPCLLMIKSLR